MSANDLLTWADPYYPDGRLPGSVREAITRHLDGGLAAHYTDALGLPSLREAIAARFPASATVAPHANQVIVTAGSTTGLYFAMSVLFGRGDEIIVTDPGFPDYLSDCAGLGLTPVSLTLRAGDGWQIDEDALEALVTERTRGLVLANPLNPTTTVLTRGSAEAIGRVAARHGLLVVNDEAFPVILLYAMYVLTAGAATTPSTSASWKKRPPWKRGTELGSPTPTKAPPARKIGRAHV